MPKPNMIKPEKPKKFKKSLKDLIVFCKKYMPVSILAMLLSGVGAILSLIGPNKLKELTNLITKVMFSGINSDAVLSICFLLVGISLEA